MRVLFLGDIIGRAGRKALQKNLKEIKQKYQIDFTIINGENSAGVTHHAPHSSRKVLELGIELRQNASPPIALPCLFA